LNLTREAQHIARDNISLEDALPTRMPVYVNSIAYLFGAATLSALAVLILSGLVISVFGPEWYHRSNVGHFFNSLHFWGVQVFFGVLVLHVASKFFMVAWRDGRWKTWMVGVAAFGVATFTALTGFLSQTNWDSQWIAVQAKDAMNAVGIGAFLPSALTFADNGDGTGTVTGTAQVAAGSYPVTFSVDDGHNPPVTAGLNIIATREDAMVTHSLSSPTAVKVNAPGGTAGPITLSVNIAEATDEPTDGNISNAVPVAYTLTPMGPGSSYTCAATTSGGGVGGTLAASCSFASVPVNVYDVHVTIGGNFYQGSGDTVLAVYDPSLGFVTGGGVVMHDGVRANFGFNAKYVKSGQIKGSLLYIEHRPSGDVILKSNAMGSLSIVGNTAYILGKATLNGVGNYKFRATVVDFGEPGTADRFGLQVNNPSNVIVSDLTFSPITLAGGNIQVPHR